MAADTNTTDERLEDGWHRDTPAGDTILHSYVTGFADWLHQLGVATGARTLCDDDLGALDTGGEFFLGNGGVLRHPPDPAEWPGLVARVQEFYAEGGGRSWILFSAWPTPDLRAEGLQLVGHPPFMIRAAGGDPPPDPAGVAIVETHDTRTQADFARALAESYPAPGAEFLSDPAVLTAPGTRCWVAYLGDRPVGTSAAHVVDACNHVEFVSTHPDVRGRGVGAALTGRAAHADPTLPAALLASDPGRPVYERLGFLPIVRFTAWSGAAA